MKTTTITALWQAPLPAKQGGKTSSGQETFEDWLQQDGYYRHHQAQWEASPGTTPAAGAQRSPPRSRMP